MAAALARLPLLLLAMTAAAGCDYTEVGGTDLEPAVVEGKRWERAVVVEQRRIVEGEGWELPDSAEVLSRERRYSHDGQEVVGHRTDTRQVPRTERVADGTETRSREVEERVRTGTRTYVCGQRDLGNGYFEDVECTEPAYETRTRTETWEEPGYREATRYDTVRERVAITRPVPVYRTWYTWRVPRWVPADTLRAEGDTTRPAWPDTAALGPGRRVGARSSRYTVTLRTGGARVHVPTYLGLWHRLRPGQRAAFRPTAARDTTRTAILPPQTAFTTAAPGTWASTGCRPPIPWAAPPAPPNGRSADPGKTMGMEERGSGGAYLPLPASPHPSRGQAW